MDKIDKSPLAASPTDSTVKQTMTSDQNLTLILIGPLIIANQKSNTRSTVAHGIYNVVSICIASIATSTEPLASSLCLSLVWVDLLRNGKASQQNSLD